MARKSKNKPLKPIIEIYCEGESEVKYFQMLSRKYHGSNVNTQRVGIDVHNMHGWKGTKLIEEIVKKVQILQRKKSINQVYAVFDKDDLSDADLKNAKKIAKECNITILFSSIDFEVWILLHYELFSRAYTAQQLVRKLSGKTYFGQNYANFKGNQYDKYLFDKVSVAVKNGRHLKRRNSNPLKDEPYVNIQDHIRDIFGEEG